MGLRAPHQKIKDYFSRLNDSNREIAQQLRSLILNEIPSAEEQLMWGQPTYNGIYIAGYTNHVNLGFFNGTDLADPNNLLEGTGKKLRHVKIHDLSQLQNMSENLRPLIRESFEMHKTEEK